MASSKQAPALLSALRTLVIAAIAFFVVFHLAELLLRQVNAATYTNVSSTLSRQAAGATDVAHTISFDTAVSLSAGTTITVEFPVGFNVTQAPTGGTGLGTGPSFGSTVTTMTATCGTGGCPAGTITITGGEATNPGVAGYYILEITNDENSDSAVLAVSISDDDEVDVTASVDPVLAFNAGTQGPGTPCSEIFSGNAGTLALGVITTSAVTSSDQTSPSSIDHICSRVTTNASGGANVTVRDSNDGLESASTPSDVIDSVATGSATLLTAGTEGFGICIDSSGGSGTALGASPVASSPYDTTCTSTDHNIVGTDGVDRLLWSVSGPSDRAHMSILVKVAIDGSTVAHADYENTLTLIATGNF